MPEKDELDCGALAAVATEIFRMRDESAAQIQLVVRYSATAAAGWRTMWEDAGESGQWVSGRLCYHEATAVMRQGGLLLWDPTENRWLEPEVAMSAAFCRIEALKPEKIDACADPIVRWGSTQLRFGSWTVVNPEDVNAGA